MIDLSKIRYRVAVMSESGIVYNIREYIQNLGWEENENEIAVRTSFTARNDKTSKGYLSSILKPGCLVGIFATDGNAIDEEVARGYVETWNTVEQNSQITIKAICYDELYKLQKSQDNRFYSSGTGTKSAIQGIFNDWKVPQGEYKGPNATHGKLVYNNSYLSDIILSLLDDAEKKGEERCIIRTSKGYTSVIPRGSNDTIYVFRRDNSKQFNESISIDDLVTRVKVIGQADDEGKTSVEVTIDGLTKYGIRQRIYTRGSDETLADAKSAVQKILDEDGKAKKEMIVESPDVPFIRKGDLVYIISGLTSNYYYVKSIQHNCESYSMTMTLELSEQDISNNTSGMKNGYSIGDVVQFVGGTHYVSSYSDSKGYPATAGPAKITIKNGSGKTHPWHLIHTDSTSNVYGWVDEGTFS